MNAMNPFSLLRPLRIYIKRFLPKTLFGRSFLIIVTPVIILHAITLWVFYDRLWDAMTNKLSQAVAIEIGMTVNQIETADTIEERQMMLQSAGGLVGIPMVFRQDESLGETAKSDNGVFTRMLKANLRQVLHRNFQVLERDRRGWYRNEWYIVRIQMSDGVLEALVPERRIFSSTTHIFLLWTIGSAIILFTVALIFMRNQIRPIRRLAIAADNFGKGREVEAFPSGGATEVRQAAAAFKVMKERIQRQISQRTEMLAGVSHDLRTPLTRMKLQLAMMKPGTEADNLGKDVQAMEALIDEYLAFAKGEGAETTQPCDIVSLVDGIVSDFVRQGCALTLTLSQRERGQTEHVISVRPNALKRCVSNIVANACRYGKNVWVSVRREEGFVEIIVDDDGPGIPEKLREDVFRPFFRIEGSRNVETGGIGLGLAIARDIARSHGGDIILSGSPHGGLRAIIRVPV